MKKKTMAFVMSLLMIVALVGVGFATWVITADKEDTKTGNITVDSVVDTRIGMTVSWVGPDSNVYFGAPTTKEAEGIVNPWLTNDSVEKSDLDVQLQLELSNLVIGNEYGLKEIKFEFTGGEQLKAATDANYVVAPTINAVHLFKDEIGYYLSQTPSDTEFTEGTDVRVNDGKATIIIDVKFAWGTVFDSTNPYVFYNNKEITEAENAQTALKALAALNTETFNIKITASAAKLATE